jgi:hypothetical protein
VVFLKTSSPTSFTPSPIVKVPREVHPLKALSSITYTESGTTHDCNEEHLLKISCESLSILGNVISVIEEHSLKAASPIDVTFSGIITEDKLVQPQNTFFLIVVTLSGILIDSKLVQSLNKPLSSTVNLEGNTIYVSEGQSLNTHSPKDTTVSGI